MGKYYDPRDFRGLKLGYWYRDGEGLIRRLRGPAVQYYYFGRNGQHGWYLDKTSPDHIDILDDIRLMTCLERMLYGLDKIPFTLGVSP